MAIHEFDFLPNEGVIVFNDGVHKTRHKLYDFENVLEKKIQEICVGKSLCFHFITPSCLYCPETMKVTIISSPEIRFLEECLDFHEYYTGPFSQGGYESDSENSDEGINLRLEV